MIEVNVTSTDFTVTVTDSVSNITVTADNSLFTVTSVVSNVTVTNVTPIITFNTEGAGFDFAIKNRGEWIPNGAYTRNDVVRYENSIYICQIQFGLVLNNEFPPTVDTLSWELFYWNQWPKQYLTITNWLDVLGDVSIGDDLTVVGDIQGGTLDINGDANIDGRLTAGRTVITTGTFTDLTVNNQFTINGLRYPINKGTYGQVLFTGGDETSLAAWVNLGELVFWSLSSDLQTNGFNIVTGRPESLPVPQMTIGSGNTSNLQSKLTFRSNGWVDLKGAGRLFLSDTNSESESAGANIIIDNDISLDPSQGSSSYTPAVKILSDLRITGEGRYITGEDTVDPAPVGEGGIRFFDGTVQTSAATGGFTATQIATASRLGVIRVGDNLSINSSTGVLSAILPNPYSLPAASTSVRGGIRVGNGLVMSGPSEDILNVSTSTEFGNVSLTQDLYTNGYKVTFNSVSAPNCFLDMAGGTILMQSSANTAISLGTVDLDIAARDEVNVTAGDQVNLLSPVTQIGSTVSSSTVYVGRIYNYAGTGAPFFPAGTQYQDNTIQRTAWRGYDQGLIP